MVGGLGNDARGFRIQRRHVFGEGGREAFGEGTNVFAIFRRGLDDLVINISDVAGIRHLRVEALQQPVQHIKHHHRAGIADMDEVIDRGAAHVEGDAVGIQRNEVVLLPGEGVVQLESHFL